jgi:AAA domain
MSTDNKRDQYLLDPDEEKLQPLSWDELLIRPRRQLLVEELLFTTGVTTLVAPSQEGKTTLAMSIALTVTTAQIWAGQTIKPRPLIWIAAEGQDDILPIYEAWMKDHPRAVKAPGGFWLEQAVNFGSRDKTKDFIKLLEERKIPPALFVIDALGDVNEVSNLDEDKSRDMYRIYANIWRVVRANKGTFLILHHTGWDETRGKGSVAMRNKSDIEVQITNYDVDGKLIELRHNKRRGGRKLKSFAFEIKLVKPEPYPQPVPIITGRIIEAAIGEKSEGDKVTRELELNELAYQAALSLYKGTDSWIQWSDWLELTKLKRPGGKLGNHTFNETVKRLITQERIRKNWEGLYQVVLQAGTPTTPDLTATASPATSSSTSTSGFPPFIRGEKQQKSEVTSRSTSGSSEVTPTGNSNNSSSVVPDKGAIALEKLLNKKTA